MSRGHAHVPAGPTSAPAPDVPGPVPADPVLDLQGVVGNSAVAGLLAGRPTGPGAALPPAARARLEAAFGRPLDHVRVHSGADAATAARSVGARAFTVGDHIVLPDGPQVGSGEGYRTLAHEVTHVVQQRGRSGAPRRTRPGEPLETEAGATADRVAAGEPAGPVSAAAGPVLARDDSGPWAVTEWLGEKAKAGKEAAYSWLIRQIRDLHRSGIARLRRYGERWQGTRRAVWDGIVDAVDVTMTILEGLVYGVVGIVAGFVTGILQMVVGLLKMVVGVCEGILKLLYGFVDGGREFDTWAHNLLATIRAIPAGLKMLVDDWLAEFRTASPERAGLMIGELTGQILAFLATLGVSAGKVGTLAQSAKLGPRLANLAASVPRILVTETGETVFVAAAEATPQAVAATTKAVGTVAAATEVAGPTVLAAVAHGGGAGGGSGGGGSGGGSGKGTKKPSQKQAAQKQAAPQKQAGSGSDYTDAERAAAAAADQYRANLVKRFPKLADAELASAARPVGGPGLWEESVYTGSGRRSWTAKLRDGRAVQLDDIDQAGTIVDTKMRDLGLGRETPPAPHPDVVEQIRGGPAPRGRTYSVFDEKAQNQLLRQLRFARENGLRGVRWETNSAEVAQEIRRYAANVLSDEERRLLTVTPVER